MLCTASEQTEKRNSARSRWKGGGGARAGFCAAIPPPLGQRSVGSRVCTLYIYIPRGGQAAGSIPLATTVTKRQAGRPVFYARRDIPPARFTPTSEKAVTRYAAVAAFTRPRNNADRSLTVRPLMPSVFPLTDTAGKMTADLG